MLIVLFVISLALLYLYGYKKLRRTLKANNIHLSSPQKKYSVLLLVFYSLLILFTLFLAGNYLSDLFIQYYLYNMSGIQYPSEFAFKSVKQTLIDMPDIIAKNPTLDGMGQLSFYIDNPSLIAIYHKYQHIKIVNNLILFAVILLSGYLIFQKIIKVLVVKLNFQSRFESYVKFFLASCALITVMITISIILSLFWESLLFFKSVPVLNFLFGTHWTPQNYHADPVNSFGIVPLVTGTFLIAFIAVTVALIIAVPSAIYMSEFMPKKIKTILKPVLELLSGIPTIVYGFFAALVLGPAMVKLLSCFNISATSESAIVAGLIIGIMIVPFISSATDDVLTSIPNNLREGGYALGCLPYEVILKILFPLAFPGIVASFLLAFSRAIGETMIVVMASGLIANLTLNPFHAVTTITTQIVTTVQGDQDFGSIKTISLFALGFTLFCITLLLNLFSFWMIKKFQKQW